MVVLLKSVRRILKRDEIRIHHHHASGYCLSVIFGKPLHTFPDHALKRQT